MSIQYSKIAVIRIDKAGDLLLTTPALRVIKEQFPDSKTYLIASKQNSKVLINSELVDKIIVYDKNISFIKKLKLLIKIRKEKFDLCLVFSPINAAYYFCYLSKSKTKGVIIFTSRYKKIFNNLSYRFIPQIISPFFTNTILKVKRYKKIVDHHSISMIKLLKMVGIRTKKNIFGIEINFDKNLTKQITNKYRTKYKNIILIHLSTRWLNNNYNIIDLIDLIKKINDIKKTKIIFTTDNSDNYIKYEISKELKIKKIRLKNFLNHKSMNQKMLIFDHLNFENLKNLINSSNIIITPHTSVTHIAAGANKIIFDIHNINNDANKMFQEYGPIFSKFEFFKFDKRKKLNKLIIDKIKKYLY